MKSIVSNLVAGALEALPDMAEAAADLDIASTVERTRDPEHGDFASNVAMRLAKAARSNPRELATKIVEHLPDNTDLDKVEIAGPGFINFYLGATAYHEEVKAALDAGEGYGRQPAKEGPRVLLEFVSANPTGPLHVGHGLGAAYGATLGNLLEAAGYPVYREYYVNDAGRQMDILGASVWLRWLEARGVEAPFPQGGYRGDYIRDIAEEIDTKGIPVASLEDVVSDLPPDAPEGDKDKYVEAVVDRARQLLGADDFDRIRQQSLESIRADIEDDLAEFGVTYDSWYSEQSLEKADRINDALAVLEERGMLYKEDGATWFPATKFGDE